MGGKALAQLATKKVGIVGLGSGGGFAALTLAMCGVGHFVLIDDDVIEASNVVRHVADLRDVGRAKVDAVADQIRHRNPNAQITPVRGRVEDHREALNGADIIIVGVDGERAKYTINEVCRESGLTAIYAGVYERGEGGDVVVIRPPATQGDTPCYACWAQQLREETVEVNPSQADLDYGMIGDDGTLEAEPGLFLHVVRVASAQADMALNELLIGQPIHHSYPANTVIFANVEMEIFEGVTAQPYSAVWLEIERDPLCLVCGDPNAGSEMSLDQLAGGLLTNDENSGTAADKPGL
jgi:molybdopterin/thiamine biosynthesis adenylyltransferase